MYMQIHWTCTCNAFENNNGCLANIQVEQIKILVTLNHSTISVSTSNYYTKNN